MPRGGAREGAGRKKGQRTRIKFQLTAERVDDGKGLTPAQRMRMLQRQVVVLAAGDMAPEEIGAALNIPVDRLKKVFAHQLAHAKTLARAAELLRLDGQSESGKTVATKLMLETVGTIERPTENPEEDAAKQHHENIVELAVKRMRNKT